MNKNGTKKVKNGTEEKVEIPFVLIAGDKKMDTTMHAFDMFEPFKALAEVKSFVVTRIGKPTDKQLENMLKAIKEGYEKEGCRVVAIFCPGNKVGAYLDKTVKTISSGTKWGMLADALKAYGYAGE